HDSSNSRHGRSPLELILSALLLAIFGQKRMRLDPQQRGPCPWPINPNALRRSRDFVLILAIRSAYDRPEPRFGPMTVAWKRWRGGGGMVERLRGGRWIGCFG